MAWSHGFSLGDQACLAIARHMRRTATTANRDWRHLPDLGIDIRIIR